MRRFAIKTAAVAAAALMLGTGSAMAGKADDTLVWSTDREVDVALPFFNNVREMVIMTRLGWDNLVFRNLETFEYEPLLATSWKWASDTAIEMELRKGVKFHDGTDFNADDVVATINHLVREDSGVLTRRNISWMKNAEKLGDYSVRINLVKPFPAAFEFLSGPLAILPSEIWATAKKDAKGKPDYGTIDTIGTGPYKITSVVPGESVTMEKNENYWAGSPKGQPTIGKLIFKTVPDAESQIAQLMTGEIDWIWDVPKDKALDLKGSGQVQVVNAKTFRISYIAMDRAGRAGKDAKTNPTSDIRVRKAIAHAIDRNAIAKQLVGEASDEIHSACYPLQFGCTQDVPKYEYDPAKAKKLLAEAGFPDGFSTDIFAYRQREYTEAVMGYLAKIGIKTNLKYMQYKALRGVVWDGKAPFHHMTWGSYSMADVSAITSHFFKQGRDDYCMDDQIKDWLEKGDTTVDPAVRKENYKKALVKLQEELCWLPMFTYAKYYAFSKDLDFKPTNDEIPRFFTAKWK